MYVEFRNKEAISFRFLEQRNFENYSYNLGFFLLVLQYRVSLIIESDWGMDGKSESIYYKGWLTGANKGYNQIKHCSFYYYFLVQGYQYIEAVWNVESIFNIRFLIWIIRNNSQWIVTVAPRRWEGLS